MVLIVEEQQIFNKSQRYEKIIFRFSFQRKYPIKISKIVFFLEKFKF